MGSGLGRAPGSGLRFASATAHRSVSAPDWGDSRADSTQDPPRIVPGHSYGRRRAPIAGHESCEPEREPRGATTASIPAFALPFQTNERTCAAWAIARSGRSFQNSSPGSRLQEAETNGPCPLTLRPPPRTAPLLDQTPLRPHRGNKPTAPSHDSVARSARQIGSLRGPQKLPYRRCAHRGEHRRLLRCLPTRRSHPERQAQLSRRPRRARTYGPRS